MPQGWRNWNTWRQNSLGWFGWTGKSPDLDIIFTGGSATPSQGDAEVIGFVELTFPGSKVTYFDDNVIQSSDADNRDLLIISSTIGSGNIRGKFDNNEIPILNWEEALAKNNPGDFRFGTSSGKITGQTDLDLVTDKHFITEPFGVGLLQIFKTGRTISYTNGSLAPGAMGLARVVGSLVNYPLVTMNKGAIMANGQPSAGRRGMFGFENTASLGSTPEGRVLFGRMITWLTRIAEGV